MKKSTLTLCLIALFLVPTFNAQAAVGDRQEKYVNENDSLLTRLKSTLNGSNSEDRYRRWKVWGTVGYEFDDNVRLATNKKSFRPRSVDTNAGRYKLDLGGLYNFYQGEEYRGDVIYDYSMDLHDDGLSAFNYYRHRIGFRGSKQLEAWDRLAKVEFLYRFGFATLDDNTHSSENDFILKWKGQWADNAYLSAYARTRLRNFRNKGVNESVTGRDGSYNTFGLLQRFKFDEGRKEIKIGYEFGVTAVDGDNFDRISNGLILGFKTNLIEKIKFVTNFYFQHRNYNNFVGSPDREDLKYHYEFRLERLLNRNMKASVFYKRTDNNTLHDGTRGAFNYDRNIFGTELKFLY